ncbi:MAG TPA: hypothetical protein VG269_15595 [Tepidisphaeraceae bacterium]|jgi:hypothetical protein|nr:hypothetical protein [Tepidisphaeraceae bacterium]
MLEIFTNLKMFRNAATGTFLAMTAAATPAMAGGGNVVPSSDEIKGYSLLDAAKATAVFNTGPLTAQPPALPFYTLTSNATVKAGTALYVPIYFADDSGMDVPPPFPTDITDQKTDAEYLDGLVAAFGVEAFIIVVDGKVTVLDDSYISATATPPLQDGPPDGTNYIVSAAFLTPLTPGKHTIGIGGIIDGLPIVFKSETVTVK